MFLGFFIIKTNYKGYLLIKEGLISNMLSY